MEDIGILGAGAFGTALAITQAAQGARTMLWGRGAAQMAEAEAARENVKSLKGAHFPDGLTATSDLSAAAQAQTLLIALPTQAVRAFASAHVDQLEGKTLVMCCKGIEKGTGALPTQIIEEIVPSACAAVLTGPSFAQDIGLRKPTALTFAMQGAEAEAIQAALSTPFLRLYLTDDLIGAQLGGALKNVIAIAAGVTIGAGLGESARAAIMTRGFAELMRYAKARGARVETLMGLSGFGDLILTCSSEKSRNYSYGMSLAKGDISLGGKTVEGVATAEALKAEALDLDMPVTEAVAALVSGERNLQDVMSELLARPLRHEAK